MRDEGESDWQDRPRANPETPMFEARLLGALLVLFLLGIGICLLLEGDHPTVVATLQATRPEAGKPMVMEHLVADDGGERSTPVPITAEVGVLQITGAPTTHTVGKANPASVDISIHLRRADCVHLVEDLGGRCSGPVQMKRAGSPSPAELELTARHEPVHLRLSPGSAKKFSITQSSLATQEPVPSALAFESSHPAGMSATIVCAHRVPIEIALESRPQAVMCSAGQEAYETQITIRTLPRLVLFLNDIATIEVHLRSERVKAVLDGTHLQLDGDVDGKADVSQSTIEVASPTTNLVDVHLDSSSSPGSSGITLRSDAATAVVDGELRNPSEFEKHKEIVYVVGSVLIGFILVVAFEFFKAWIRGGR